METPMYTAKDYDQALLTPERIFEDPMDVVVTRSLTAEQKMEVLKRWESGAQAMDVAAGENMTGGERSRLGEVRKAIDALCVRENIDEAAYRHPA
jgi:hypothetical protein